jgi:hypothetical protein
MLIAFFIIRIASWSLLVDRCKGLTICRTLNNITNKISFSQVAPAYFYAIVFWYAFTSANITGSGF